MYIKWRKFKKHCKERKDQYAKKNSKRLNKRCEKMYIKWRKFKKHCSPPLK